MENAVSPWFLLSVHGVSSERCSPMLCTLLSELWPPWQRWLKYYHRCAVIGYGVLLVSYSVISEWEG